MKSLAGCVVTIVGCLATLAGGRAAVASTIVGGQRSAEFQITGAVSDGTSIDSLASADALLAGQTPAALVRAGLAPVVNFDNPLRPGNHAHFAGKTPFLIDPQDHPNDFAVHAAASVVIPTAGLWTFGVNSDDGFALSVGPFPTSHDHIRAAADTLATFDVPTPGVYPITLTYYEHQDQSVVELFAAAGSFGSFNQAAGAFHLVGDVTDGGLALAYLPPARPPYMPRGTQAPEPTSLAWVIAAAATALIRRSRMRA